MEAFRVRTEDETIEITERTVWMLVVLVKCRKHNRRVFNAAWKRLERGGVWLPLELAAELFSCYTLIRNEEFCAAVKMMVEHLRKFPGLFNRGPAPEVFNIFNDRLTVRNGKPMKTNEASNS